MSPRWTSYVVCKPPKGWLKTQCPKFEQEVAITPKWYEIGCQLLLITNRKSHTGFRLVPTSMTLNDLERRNSPYFAFFSSNSTDFQADCVTEVEDRPMMFVKYCLPVPVFHALLAKTITHPAARSLCDSWALCFTAVYIMWSRLATVFRHTHMWRFGGVLSNLWSLLCLKQWRDIS